jgi:hypothetical protein
MACVEVSRAALKDGLALGAPTQEKMIEAHVSMEAVGANVTPHINGGCANEVEPQSEDALDGAALIPGSPRGPGFSAPWETASDDTRSILGSIDIVDLGDSELGLPGYLKAPHLPASWRQVAGV